jgi:hypothetical protein
MENEPIFPGFQARGVVGVILVYKMRKVIIIMIIIIIIIIII